MKKNEREEEKKVSECKIGKGTWKEKRKKKRA